VIRVLTKDSSETEIQVIKRRQEITRAFKFSAGPACFFDIDKRRYINMLRY
jgi:hypothetical protein